jgi:hypothetical protein
VPRSLIGAVASAFAEPEPISISFVERIGEPGADPSARLSGHAIIFGRLVGAPGRAWLTGPSGDRDHH